MFNPREGLVGREADAVRRFDSSGQQPTNLHHIDWPETASDVLACGPLYGAGYHIANGTHWTAKEKTALRLLAEAGVSIGRAADILGRPETTLAHRCRSEKIKLPAPWAKLILPARKPSPRWMPLAYPYINFRRAENETLLLVNELVARALPGREDVCQDIMLAILESGLTPDRVTVNEYIRKFRRDNYENSGYALSLDAIIPGTNDFRLIDTFSEEDSIWNRI